MQAPTDQDRANYVNWKRTYMAWQAQKQREGEDLECCRFIWDPAGWLCLSGPCLTCVTGEHATPALITLDNQPRPKT